MDKNKTTLLMRVALIIIAIVGLLTSGLVFPIQFIVMKDNIDLLSAVITLLINELSAVICFAILIILYIVNEKGNKEGLFNPFTVKSLKICGTILIIFAPIYFISYGLFSFIYVSNVNNGLSFLSNIQLMNVIMNLTLSILGFGFGIGLNMVSRYMKKAMEIQSELEGVI